VLEMLYSTGDHKENQGSMKILPAERESLYVQEFSTMRNSIKFMLLFSGMVIFP